MSAAYLDLRVRGLVNIYVTQGISYPAISFDFDDDNAPTDLKITLFAYDNGADVEYTNGNGLTISGSVALWNLGLVSAAKGKYNGTIETESVIFGQSIKLKLLLEVE